LGRFALCPVEQCRSATSPKTLERPIHLLRTRCTSLCRRSTGPVSSSLFILLAHASGGHPDCASEISGSARYRYNHRSLRSSENISGVIVQLYPPDSFSDRAIVEFTALHLSSLHRF